MAVCLVRKFPLVFTLLSLHNETNFEFPFILERAVYTKRYTPSCFVSHRERRWFVIDAEGVVLGRLASFVANVLRGKNKAIFTPHDDCGDYVVVINAEKVGLTGKKRKDKVYHWHTGFPGGLKTRTADQILTGKHPERVIKKAVERMIPRGPLGSKVLRKLKVYAGPTHPHEAQMAQVVDMAKLNAKNVVERAAIAVPENAASAAGI